MTGLNLLDHPICFATPRRLTPGSAWQEHIPFAMFLMDVLRPDVVVELGTRYGDAYCALCQAVQVLRLRTRCYAVDTWRGDSQTGLDGRAVLAELRAHHDPLYGSFSRLIESTFDEALMHHADGTIDLLHVDACHADDAVKHDFEAWLPKMSDQGIVLLHDVNLRKRDFGVWRLWGELNKRYPCFEFVHGHGLGVLAVGKHPPEASQELFKASEDEVARIRRCFFALGGRLKLQVQLRTVGEEVARLQVEQGRMARETVALGATVQRQGEALGERERRLVELRTEGERLAQGTLTIEARVRAQEEALRETERQVAELGTETVRGRTERERLVQEAVTLRAGVRAQQDALTEIHSSLGWRLVERYWQVRDRLLVPGSRMRRLYDAMMIQMRRSLSKGLKLVRRRGPAAGARRASGGRRV